MVHLMETGLPIFEDILTDYDVTQCEEGMTLALHLKRPIETMRAFMRTYEECGRMCGCGRGPEAVRNATEVVSAFKLRQMRKGAAAAAWPYFDLENPEDGDVPRQVRVPVHTGELPQRGGAGSLPVGGVVLTPSNIWVNESFKYLQNYH